LDITYGVETDTNVVSNSGMRCKNTRSF